MRRVLDGLVWVFLTGLVGGSFWYFSGQNEPVSGGFHSASTDPGHVQRCRSCSYYLGRSYESDPWSPTAAKSGMPIE